MKLTRNAVLCVLKLLKNNKKLILAGDKVKTSKEGLPSGLREDYSGIEGVVERFCDTTDALDDARESIHYYVKVSNGEPLILPYGWLELVEESDESKAMKEHLIKKYKKKV